MKRNFIVRQLRRAGALFFIALAVAGSRTRIAINWPMGVLKRFNLAWWQKGLFITLQLYDRFTDRNEEDNGEKRSNP